MAAPQHPNEAERLDALHRLEILDTDASAAWDALAKLASSICETPIGLVSLVDDERQWFKAAIGLNASQTHRDQAFCAHAILGDGIFTVRDAATDDRFADNPLVTGDPNIRFYAGAPLHAPGGEPLGTVCVIDRQPRNLDARQEQALQVIAKQAEELLHMRQLALQLIAKGTDQSILDEIDNLVIDPLVPQGIQISNLRGIDTTAQHGHLVDDLQRHLNSLRDLVRTTYSDRTAASK